MFDRRQRLHIYVGLSGSFFIAIDPLSNKILISLAKFLQCDFLNLDIYGYCNRVCVKIQSAILCVAITQWFNLKGISSLKSRMDNVGFRRKY